MATVLFVTPHQDDESLSMGAAIRAHLEAGHDVHVLLLTTGQNSAARSKTSLDVPQFIEARDDEMKRACRRLGVRFANIHVIPMRAEDGALTVEGAIDGISWFLFEHPDAWVKTYSDRSVSGRHSDHINTGKAAKQLFDEGTITNLRFYVEP